jgi:hypothetical protein
MAKQFMDGENGFTFQDVNKNGWMIEMSLGIPMDPVTIIKSIYYTFN